MEPGVVIRGLLPGDAAKLAANLRDADRLELCAAGYPDVLSAICESISKSTACRVALADGQLAAIFGVVHETDDTGVMWCLGTNVIEHNKRRFIIYASAQLRDFLEICPTLYNYVDHRNALALKWLRYSGCVAGETRPGDGTYFIRMTLTHDNLRKACGV